jgi:hypothetical protein
MAFIKNMVLCLICHNMDAISLRAQFQNNVHHVYFRRENNISNWVLGDMRYLRRGLAKEQNLQTN